MHNLTLTNSARMQMCTLCSNTHTMCAEKWPLICTRHKSAYLEGQGIKQRQAQGYTVKIGHICRCCWKMPDCRTQIYFVSLTYTGNRVGVVGFEPTSAGFPAAQLLAPIIHHPCVSLETYHLPYRDPHCTYFWSPRGYRTTPNPPELHQG